MYMASNRKIWKTRKLLQLILSVVLILVLVVVIYRSKEGVQLDNGKEIQIALARTHLGLHNGEGRVTQGDVQFKPDGLPSFKPLSASFVKVLGAEEDRDVVFEEDVSETGFEGERIVHLDLKGAPPKVSYLAELFPFIRRVGATGILLEYEDMFPYSSLDVVANNAYSTEEIAHILKLAKQHSLDVIPLIQTFGHLEFVLKLEKYMHLREDKKYPQAICPSKNESLILLYSMIDDILETHKEIKYFHIGCDEVYQLGECSDCKEAIQKNRWTNKELFLNHVSKLARYIDKKSNGKVKPLIWDDELRTLSLEDLQEWKIGELVEPVVWKYTADVEAYLTHEIWDKYSVVFKEVWFASAFKGARAPNEFINYINSYFQNHKSWLGLISRLRGKVQFRGGILTGWQRYDHFATLCELLPVSVPSLVLNLLYLSTHVKSLVELSLKTQKECKCDANPVTVTMMHISCSFPGSSVFVAVSRLPAIIIGLQRVKDESPYKGWMSDFNIKHSFSNPSHVEEATNEIVGLYSELREVETELFYSLSDVFDNATVSEWMYTFVRPVREEIRTAVEARDRVLAMSSWPKRPLV